MPETLGLFEAVIFIAVEDWIFVETVNAYSIKNIYEIGPIYLTDVMVNVKVEVPLLIKNALVSDSITI